MSLPIKKIHILGPGAGSPPGGMDHYQVIIYFDDSNNLAFTYADIRDVKKLILRIANKNIIMLQVMESRRNLEPLLQDRELSFYFTEYDVNAGTVFRR